MGKRKNRTKYGNYMAAGQEEKYMHLEQRSSPPFEATKVVAASSATTPASVVVPIGEKDQTKRNRLRFTLYVWSKLQFMCHRGPTEIGGWGIGEPDDPLLITDFLLVPQEADSAYVEFDDAGMGQYVYDQDQLGRQPYQYLRIWCHTHPGSSPSPSGQDVRNFDRVFEHTDFGVMFILARGGQTSCRLRVNGTLKFQQEIPVDIDTVCTADVYKKFKESDWEAEYTRCVKPRSYSYFSQQPSKVTQLPDNWRGGSQQSHLWDRHLPGIIETARQDFRKKVTEIASTKPRSEDDSKELVANFSEEWMASYREYVQKGVFVHSELDPVTLAALEKAGLRTKIEQAGIQS